MRKDSVGEPCLRSLSLSFKRQRWDFYDPQYYCVWALLSLLQAAKNYRLPVLYPQVCRFSIQTTHATPQPRLKGGPRKPPVSSSTTALCLALSTHQHHCPCSHTVAWGQHLWDGLGLSPPFCGTCTFLMWSSAGVVGKWPLGYMLPALSFPLSLLSDHHSSLLYLCLMLFSSSVFYFPFLESHLH